jgi:hypothetical protein
MTELVRRRERRQIDLAACARNHEQQRAGHPKVAIFTPECQQPLQKISIVSGRGGRCVGRSGKVHRPVGADDDELGTTRRFRPPEALRDRKRQCNSLFRREIAALGREIRQGECLMFVCHAAMS